MKIRHLVDLYEWQFMYWLKLFGIVNRVLIYEIIKLYSLTTLPESPSIMIQAWWTDIFQQKTSVAGVPFMGIKRATKDFRLILNGNWKYTTTTTSLKCSSSYHQSTYHMHKHYNVWCQTFTSMPTTHTSSSLVYKT